MNDCRALLVDEGSGQAVVNGEQIATTQEHLLLIEPENGTSFSDRRSELTVMYLGIVLEAISEFCSMRAAEGVG